MNRFRNGDQFKSFIKKEAKRLDISIPNAYSTFISRSFLEKLVKCDTEKLILVKGSCAETSYLSRMVRGITDIDIASTNTIDYNIPLLTRIVDHKKVNGISFNISKKPIKTKTGIYKFKFNAELDNVKNGIGVDFQDRYDRLLEKTTRVMPKLFEGDQEFEITVPSFEEYLAEKLCIVLESNSSDILNTRIKDFYDIYELHGGNYNIDKLSEYFKLMLLLRGKMNIKQARTDFLDKTFVENHLDIWNNLSKKYDFLDKDIDLQGAVYYTRAVLREYLQKNGAELKQNKTYHI